jgi:hypothetical protein
MDSEYALALDRARVLQSRRRRRWAAVTAGLVLLVLGHVLLWAWVGDRYGFCWSDCPVEGGDPPLVESYLVLGLALWVLAPFAMARLAGRSWLGTVAWGCVAITAVAAVLTASERVTAGEATSLPGLTLAVAVGGAIALPWRNRRDLTARGAAVVLCVGLSLVLASLGLEAVDWGNLAALSALAAIGLADEAAASRRE